jgi:CheY-like chemotaxis protein
MSGSTYKPLFKRVLVIDDNETDRYIAKRMISKYQFAEETIVMESAPKALDYLLSLKETPELLPEFIFLDIRMPEMDGFEFLQEYEKLPEAVRINCVILMLSTSLDKTDHERASSSKYINRFLNKPLDKEKMEMLEAEFLAKMNC